MFAILVALAMRNPEVEFTFQFQRLSQLSQARAVFIGDNPELDQALKDAKERVLSLIRLRKRPP
jgi:hypothetical protein